MLIGLTHEAKIEDLLRIFVDKRAQCKILDNEMIHFTIIFQEKELHTRANQEPCARISTPQTA